MKYFFRLNQTFPCQNYNSINFIFFLIPGRAEPPSGRAEPSTGASRTEGARRGDGGGLNRGSSLKLNITRTDVNNARDNNIDNRFRIQSLGCGVPSAQYPLSFVQKFRTWVSSCFDCLSYSFTLAFFLFYCKSFVIINMLIIC